ncbi:MAG: FHA domain-containing protein [Bacteroidales bacterium]|nr:FHA domain-containing protein [Bacteroidales bacterium]
MKIIRIGRSRSNDIVISDPTVSSMHCQIIRDDNGRFRIIDTNSTNGTYINGIRRQGDVVLQENDIVRIGNSTIPWREYFNSNSTFKSPQPTVPHQYPEPIDDPEEEGANGVGITGFVIAIISIFLFWIPYFGPILPFVSLILSIIGVTRPKKGLAIAGLIISIIILIISLIVSIIGSTLSLMV